MLTFLSVVDKDGQAKTLNISADIKGIKGTDGRCYLLDTYRLNPVDIAFVEDCKVEANLPEYPHQIAMLRPELVQLFFENKLRKEIQDQLPRTTPESKSATSESDACDKSATSEIDATKKTSVENSTEPNEDKEQQELQKIVIPDNFEVSFNPDLFTTTCKMSIPEVEEERKKHDADIREACDFLHTSIIPQIVSVLQTLNWATITHYTL
jgi:protein TIF31